MGKNIRCAALIVCCCLLLCGCTASAQERYERGQMYLGFGDYATAREIFQQLGGYGDAEKYALYCAARQAMADGDWTLAEANLRLIDPFASSTWCLQYIDAARLAEEGDLAGALEGFEALGSFLDSDARARSLRAEIPSRELERIASLVENGHYDQARNLLSALDASPERDALLETCDAGEKELAYTQAMALYTSQAWMEAIPAFDALGDYRDSAARLLACRSNLYRAAEAAAAQATLDTVAQAIEDFRFLEDYLDSASRAEALASQWEVNLRLRAAAASAPYVVFGSYPLGETGEPMPVLWRVAELSGDSVTLLSYQVLDAMAAAEATSLPLTLSEAEAAAAPEIALPTEALITVLYPAAEDRRCTATAYALAQGVRHHQDGSAWYYLAEAGEAGFQRAVWYNGEVLQVDAGYDGVGVRPVLRLSLNAYAFTQGDGSAENPYR